jgi:hypothetical protein
MSVDCQNTEIKHNTSPRRQNEGVCKPCLVIGDGDKWIFEVFGMNTCINIESGKLFS